VVVVVVVVVVDATDSTRELTQNLIVLIQN
jgi:hypothetical protein